MKTKQILIALGILLILGAYLYFGEIRKKQAEERKKAEANALVYGINKDDVTEVVIKNKEAGELKMLKAGNEWKIEEPPVYGNKATIETMIDKFIKAEAERKIENANPADYGLDLPEVTCRFVTKDGEEREIYIGNDNPTGSYVYAAKKGNAAAVYIINSSLKLNAAKGTDNFRFKGALMFGQDDVTKIKVNLKEKKYTLEKKDGSWHIVSPLSKPAKKERVTSLISSYRTSSAMEIIKPDKAALKKYKIGDTGEYLEFYEGNKKHVFKFGKFDKEKKQYYAKGSLTGEIMKFGEFVYTGVPKLDEVESKQLVIFDQDVITKFEAEYGEHLLSAEKEKDSWQIKKAKGISGSQKKNINLPSLVSTVYWLEYKKAEKDTGDAERYSVYGLVPGKGKIRLYGKKQKLLGTIILGETSGDNENFYAKVPERGMIYKIPVQFIKNLNLPGLE